MKKGWQPPNQKKGKKQSSDQDRARHQGPSQEETRRRGETRDAERRQGPLREPVAGRDAPLRRGSPSGAWILEPRDSLMLGDNRPVGDAGRRSLDIPWPSSLAGLVRTRIGLGDDGVWRLGREQTQALLDVAVRGPWLVGLDSDGAPSERFFPAPADAVWHRDEAGLRRTRLLPALAEGGCLIDHALHGWEPVVPAEDLPEGKPERGPAYWSERALLEWLRQPAAVTTGKASGFGIKELRHETRIHVAIDPQTGTAMDGRLFATEGVRFTVVEYLERGLGTEDAFWGTATRRDRLALGFACEDERLPAGACTLGGEARISMLRAGGARWAWPGSLAAGTRRLRVVLLSPAIFTEGSMPERIAGAKVVAGVVGRPQVVSGWDYLERMPKPSRRMVPAGSVYWVEFSSPGEAHLWAEEHWMNCISDGEQDRRDGFGLCAVGVG